MNRTRFTAARVGDPEKVKFSFKERRNIIFFSPGFVAFKCYTSCQEICIATKQSTEPNNLEEGRSGLGGESVRCLDK